MYIGAQPSHLVVNDHPPDILVPATVPVVQPPVVNDNQPDNIEEVTATAPGVQPPVDPVKTKSGSDNDAISEKIKVLESDSDNDALSKSIKILRNLMEAETEKKDYWEQKYREAVAKKEKLRKLLNLSEKRVKRLINKKVTRTDKLKIVKEILSESNFTEAQCGIFILFFINKVNSHRNSATCTYCTT